MKIKSLVFQAGIISAVCAGMVAFTASEPVAAAPHAGKAAVEETEAFPLRKKYPALKCLSTKQFTAMMSSAIIVDARNSVEFDVIHIEKAVNIPATSMERKQLADLRAPDGKQPIVFYCNGTTCTKSYKGCEKARIFGFENIYVYDAGVLSFALENPTKTIFFGKPMRAKSVKDEIISKDDFAAICLSTPDFLAKVRTGEYKVFDLRDADERKENPIEIEGVTGGTIDEFVAWLADPNKVPASKILLMDWVGKQVRWAHYYLRKEKRTDFFFLEGGVKAWIKAGYDPKGNPGAPKGEGK